MVMSAISRGLAARPSGKFFIIFGEARPQFAVAVFIAQTVSGAGFHQVKEAVGFNGSGIDPNDANAIA